MSETAHEQHEMTPQGLRDYIEGICVDFLAYTKPSVFHEDTTTLLLQAKTGERIIIEKSKADAQPDGNFLQDLRMSVHPGASRTFDVEQLDFNFGQYGDGQLRRRVISGIDNGVQPIPENISSEGMAHLSRLTLHNIKEAFANLDLEESMGLNNNPATSAEVAEAMSYLDGAAVLDGQYQPVAILAL